MEILVLGVVLLVLGLGATYAYDHRVTILTFVNSLNSNTSKKKSLENITRPSAPTPAARSNPLRPQDFSIHNQQMTVQELIAKLESMKKNK